MRGVTRFIVACDVLGPKFQALKDLTPGRDDEKANNLSAGSDVIVPVRGL
jgi:hypothetical protein